MNDVEYANRIVSGEIKQIGLESFHIKQNENGNGVLVLRYLYSDGSIVETELQQLIMKDFEIVIEGEVRKLIIPIKPMNDSFGTARVLNLTATKEIE